MTDRTQAKTAMPKLSERERAVLNVLVDAGGPDDFGFLSFRGIASRGKIDPSTVRRSVRALARKGLAQFEKGLWSDDGEPRGSGYCATREAIAVLQPKDPAP